MSKEYEDIFAAYLREHGYTVTKDREAAVERMLPVWRRVLPVCGYGDDDLRLLSADMLDAAAGEQP